MKLTHDVEAQKKGPDEKSDDKKGFSKSPLTDKLMGRVLALALATAAPTVIAVATIPSCTFQPAGLEMEQDGDTDATIDSGPDADADIDAGHDSGPDADVDAGPDADVDADVDAGPDADVDADVDAGPDADVDADVDAGPDADVDAGPDADVDAGPDADVDAGPDADVDGGPVACPGAIAENFNGVINSGVPQEVGNYNFEYASNAGGQAVLNILCGVTPIESGVAFPVGVMTPFDRSVDGLEIQVTPTNVAPTWTLVTINVVTHP